MTEATAARAEDRRRDGGLIGRGAALSLLAAAAALCFTDWARAPLGTGIDAWSVPLTAPAELEVPRFGRAPLTIGGLVIAVAAAGAVVSIFDPRRIGVLAGLVLCLAIAGNAALWLGSPLTMERLDRQAAERAEIAALLVAEPGKEPVTSLSNGLVHAPDAPGGPEEFALLGRGGVYLWGGVWLAALSLAGVVLGTRGRWRRRAGTALAWLSAAAVLGLLIGGPRLLGEFRLAEASHHESRAEWALARAAVAAAIETCPPLAGLERTRLLIGRIDLGEGAPTHEAALVATERLARLGRLAEAVEASQRAGSDSDRAARRSVSRVWRDRAVDLMTAAVAVTDAGVDESVRRRQLHAAADAWRHAAAADPESIAAMVGSLVAQARLGAPEPPLVMKEWERLDAACRDRFVRADAMVLVGDALSRAGDADGARRMYVASFDELNLPQRKNLRAQERIGGL